MRRFRCLVAVWGFCMMTNVVDAESVSLKFQSQRAVRDETTKSERSVLEEVERMWKFEQTAVIVCDVWDAITA